MPITITITLNHGDTLADLLEQAGILRPDAARPPELTRILAEMAETRAGLDAVFAEKAVLDEAVEAVPAVSNVVDQPKKRGRPAKNPHLGSTLDTAHMAATGEIRELPTTLHERIAAGTITLHDLVASIPVEHEETLPFLAPAARIYIVRRFDGQTDFDTPDSGVATERLIELINNAGELGALQALIDSNEDLRGALPDERRAEITDAIVYNRVLLTPPEPVAEPAPAPGPTYKRPDGSALTSISADKKGAQDAILAIASGAAPKFGFIVAKSLLEQMGVEKVSAIAEDDAGKVKLAELAARGAALLGLPMAA